MGTPVQCGGVPEHAERAERDRREALTLVAGLVLLAAANYREAAMVIAATK